MPKVVFGFIKEKKLDFRHVSEYDRPESPFKIVDTIDNNPVKLIINWHGFLVFDINTNIVAAMIKFIDYVGTNGCCGRCLPGKKDTVTLANKLSSLYTNFNEKDLAEAISMGKLIITNSKCSFAPTAVKVVLTFLKEFPEQLQYRYDSEDINYNFHISAPCTAACPTNIKIPEFIDQIRSKKFLSSLEIIRENMPLPGLCGRICPHPCETVCRRAEIDQAINIMNLKQSTWNYEYYQEHSPKLPEKKNATGKRCAIVGAGPAGLTAAYYLSIQGHDVDIFDMESEAGGMANYGIPTFRQPKKLLDNEINTIKSLGIKIHYNKKLGNDISIKYLQDKYDSSLLAIGAWKAKKTNISNIHNIKGIFNSGIEFLYKVSSGTNPININNSKVLIIGGGNTAIDCARTVIRLGGEATLVYRRSEKEMPANRHEIEDAIEEGVKMIFLSSPLKALEDLDGNLIGVEFIKMQLGSSDRSGRRSPEIISNSEYIIDCNYLIPAVGQKPDLSFMKDNNLMELTDWNTISVNDSTYMTSIEGIFAAGDCQTGPDTVVQAVAGGRWAAKMMDRYMLTGKTYFTPEELLEKAIYDNKIFEYSEESDIKPPADRYEAERISVDERKTTFNEVLKPMEDITASREAKRCLRCMRIAMFGVNSKK